MLRTRVGYAGGTTSAPDYQNIGDHSEALGIDFDPAQLGFERLVELFFASHNPCRPAFKRQYRSAIFFRDEKQESVARDAWQRQVQVCGGPPDTALEPYTGFTLAEDYHQKYLLRLAPEVLTELATRYPTREAFLGAATVTRANAFLGGHGHERLSADLPRMGLSDRARAHIERALR